MKTKTYTWQNVENAAVTIAMQMYNDNWRPDYIVGITRGGLALALLLSHLMKVKMYTIDVSLRDNDTDMGPESNLWMAEDAFGCMYDEAINQSVSHPEHRKNILIVDDINDTGATLNWIKKDWQSGCLPNDTETWGEVWNSNVRFATITDNLSSEFGDVKYYYDAVNKAEDDVWLIYPWEQS